MIGARLVTPQIPQIPVDQAALHRTSTMYWHDRNPTGIVPSHQSTTAWPAYLKNLPREYRMGAASHS